MSKEFRQSAILAILGLSIMIVWAIYPLFTGAEKEETLVTNKKISSEISKLINSSGYTPPLHGTSISDIKEIKFMIECRSGSRKALIATNDGTEMTTWDATFHGYYHCRHNLTDFAIKRDESGVKSDNSEAWNFYAPEGFYESEDYSPELAELFYKSFIGAIKNQNFGLERKQTWQ